VYCFENGFLTTSWTRIRQSDKTIEFVLNVIRLQSKS